MLPYGRQSINDDDLAAVTQSLQSGWLTTGPAVAEFEAAVAQVAGAKHAVAVCNATAALHLAMLVAEIDQGDRVVTSPNTFLASANCAAFVGATPDFVDIDPISYNLCPESLERNWQDDTRAVVAVDYAGQTAEMPRIAEVAHSRGAVVIEDACHAVGGRFEHDGQSWNIGGHPWADMTTFSFHPVKTMTTGEGGMLLTNNDEYAARARLLRTHGMVREKEDFTGLGSAALDERGPWYYEMQQLGYNYRITDFQCALGLSQLNRLQEFLTRRREIVARYNAAFGELNHLQTPGLRNEADRDITSWHLYTVRINFEAIGKSRTQVMAELREQGVGSQVLYIPVHLQPWYRRTFGYECGMCPVAESFYQQALSLPLYPMMTDQDVDTVIQNVTTIVGGQR
jgi:UDP-4-amino-4,6-dideoxy-N-acetyl-beta-L-altrosamine transaminase